MGDDIYRFAFKKKFFPLASATAIIFCDGLISSMKMFLAPFGSANTLTYPEMEIFWKMISLKLKKEYMRCGI